MKSKRVTCYGRMEGGCHTQTLSAATLIQLALLLAVTVYKFCIITMFAGADDRGSGEIGVATTLRTLQGAKAGDLSRIVDGGRAGFAIELFDFYTCSVSD